MKLITPLSFIAVLLLHTALMNAQSDNLTAIDHKIIKKVYKTTHLKESTIKLDGKLDDEAWSKVDWSGDFTVFQPNEGAQPSQQTYIKITYDDKYLYFGAKCLDTAIDSLEKRMSRRDEFPGDWIEINIDSYHDLRTAFSFNIAASGVRGDEFVSDNGGNWDASWNPIYFVSTSKDDQAWYAEAKIPFSQLRFDNTESKIWGLQVMRRLFRKEEKSIWQYIPQNKGVWVSEFGELHGINNIKSKRQVEIAPYGVLKSEHYTSEPGNKFADGNDQSVSFGVDGKVALTSDLIFDYTVNPDFGQVEADPSQVRLDGYQNYFQERRPFFIESANIFSYDLTDSEAGGDYDSDILFYSRRIGSSPHGYVSLNQNEYASMPSATPILGALKLSGKTATGWSIGMLESLTKNVYAKIDSVGKSKSQLIEPLTNYSVLRLQKDFNGGQTVIGIIGTSVNRKNNLSDMLHNNAFSSGFDIIHYWKDRAYYFKVNGIMSHVNGTKEKIYATQQSFEHLFQRPNADEVSLDPNRTSLTGTGATFRIGKGGGKSGRLGEIFKFESGFTYRSPELEINDIGFLQAANEIHHFTWAGYHFQKQIGIFRSARINYNHFFKWDFGGQHLGTWFNTNLHGNFKSNWGIGTGFNYIPHTISNNALRGGASLREQGLFSNWMYIESDGRKKFSYGMQAFNSLASQGAANNHNFNLYFNFQPINALSIRFNPSFSYSNRIQGQYVTSVNHDGNQKTIVSGLKQKTLSFTLRLNYNITPEFTIQFYGQPFITRPLYNSFGIINDPLAKDINQRFITFDNVQLKKGENDFQVDENKDGITDYSFQKPDFNFVQLRSNLVLRWEYKAGSEFYLVWSQGNTSFGEPDAQNVFNSLWNNAFDENNRNTLLLKLTYRFLR